MEKRIPSSNNKEASSFTKSSPQNVKVLVRVRPVLKNEFGKEKAITCSSNRKVVNINTSTNTIQAVLDGAFDENTTQKEMFDQINHFIPAVIQGFNCTIFAYGQTGSGKTHTMFGSDWENVMFKNPNALAKIQNTYVGDLENDNNFSGLIPRTIYQLFKEINKEENKSKNFAVYCSFLQIYNEKIFDLLTDKYGTNSLTIRENPIDGIYVEGLTEFCVTTFEDCLMLMQKGEKNRFIRHTSNNVKSSRSHTIFQLIVESTKADSTGKLQKAKFNLCDLAGSEKLNKSEEIANAHLSELKNINLSLTTLGKVIHNLSQSQKLPIPYRESKLTRLLQDSLGGNTNTCLVATLTPILVILFQREFVDESLNTLKFAERAKHIVTEVKPNKIEAVDAQLVAKLQQEIKYLKEILNIRRKGTSAINQVHNKLLILQEENERLRQAQFSIQEVEKLIEENKKIKMELQVLRAETQSEKNVESSPKDFEVTGGLSGFLSKGSSSPFARNGADPKIGDIIDTIQEDEDSFPKLHKRDSSQPKQNINVFDLSPVGASQEGLTFGRTSSLASSSQSRLVMAGKLLSQISLTRGPKDTPMNPIANLPHRIKGKTQKDSNSVDVGTKVPKDLQKVEERKKDQERALRRLQDLEDWQRRMREKELGMESTQGRLTEPHQVSETTSVSSSIDKQSSAYKFAEFDKIYNPYKVKQDIEKKYNGQRFQASNKSIKMAEEFSRIKNIQKNFF